MILEHNLNNILHGPALEKLKELDSESVDCCITSPPYWALRDYKTEGQIWDSVNGCEHEWTTEKTNWPNCGGGKAEWAGRFKDREGKDVGEYHDRSTSSDFCSKCNAWKGSLGLEPTFQLYIKHLTEIFNQVKRVLKKTGSCWVNMGDTYAGSGGAGGDYNEGGLKEGQPRYKQTKPDTLPAKSLCLIPQRFAIAMVDAGWICRNTIIWYKPNCMPSSAKDRFTVDFEYLFFFTKSQRYYFDTQYEPLESLDSPGGWQTARMKGLPAPFGGKKAKIGDGYNNGTYSGKEWNPSPLGRIKRCVWKIPTQPFSGSSLLADYVGTDGKPYKASPDCPVHAHLASPQVRRKEQYDGLSTSVLNRNPDKSNGHASKPVNESYTMSLNSNDMNNDVNDTQQSGPNIDEYKSHHEYEGQDVHDPVYDVQTADHTKHNHTPYEQKPCKTDCSDPHYSETAIEHNNGNHRNTSQTKPHDIASVKTPYDKPDISQVDATDVYRHDISENIPKEGSVSNEKPPSPSEQSLFRTADTSTRIKNIGKRVKCVCSVVSTDHFAVFPPALVETPLKACCPEFICRKCGKPREKIYEETGNMLQLGHANAKKYTEGLGIVNPTSGLITNTKKEIIENGITDCGCNAGFNSGVCLDPFIGSGTVGLVAMQNARNFIGIELSQAYIDMAMKRLEPYLLQTRLT